MTIWVLILLSTDHYISGHGGIVDAVLLLVCEIWRKIRPAYCKFRVCPLPQASARARMRGDEATADGIVVWCWCCCSLWLHARTRYPPLGRRGVYVKGHSRPRRLPDISTFCGFPDLPRAWLLFVTMDCIVAMTWCCLHIKLFFLPNIISTPSVLLWSQTETGKKQTLKNQGRQIKC